MYNHILKRCKATFYLKKMTSMWHYFHCKSFTYKNLFESAFAMMIFMTQTNTGTMVKRVPEEQILT